MNTEQPQQSINSQLSFSEPRESKGGSGEARCILRESPESDAYRNFRDNTLDTINPLCN